MSLEILVNIGSSNVCLLATTELSQYKDAVLLVYEFPFKDKTVSWIPIPGEMGYLLKQNTNISYVQLIHHKWKRVWHKLTEIKLQK